MSENIFRAHFERVSAKKAASHAAPFDPNAPVLRAMPTAENGPAASEYRLMLAALGEDLRQLSNIQSLERKIEAKRQMMPRYLPWIEGAMRAKSAVQDEILGTMTVWAIDVANWSLALELAAHVLANRINLPQRYLRTPGTLIAEEFAEAGLRPEPAIDLDTLMQVAALTAGEDMPDEVRAKLLKAIGIALKAQADAYDPEADTARAGGRIAILDAARREFARALELDRQSGVKALITACERELKKAYPMADPIVEPDGD